MKTIRLIMILAATWALMACDNKSNFTIQGNSSDFKDGTKAYLITIIDDKPVLLGSDNVKNHSFTIKGFVEKPCFAKIGVLESLTLNNGKGIITEIILEPGEIKLGDIDKTISNERTATGTPLNDKLTQFLREKKTITDNTTLSRKESYDHINTLIHNYIMENIDNELGIFLFERYHLIMPEEMLLETIVALKATTPSQYDKISKETKEELETRWLK